MTTVPNKIWAESRLYSTSENDQLIQALMSYHKVIENNNKAVLYFRVVKEVTLLVFFYNETVERPPAAFNCFYDIPFMKQAMQPGKKKLFDAIKGIAEVLSTEKKS